MNITNPIFSNEEMTMVDATIEHPEYGLIPTTYFVDGTDDRPDQVAALLEMEIAPYAPHEVTIVDREGYAKAARDEAVALDILYDGSMFQNDEELMKVISEAALIGVPDEIIQPWRLSDNTWRDTSLLELKEIAALVIQRKLAIWSQYSVWDSGDKSIDFTVSL